LKREELEVLREFASSLGLTLELIASNPMALEVPGARYIDVFDVPTGIAELLGYFEGHYAAGLYIGYIEGGRFKPSLPLARRLSSLCGVKLRCIVLDEEGEKRFLYGRTVRGGRVVEWVEGLTVVLNRLGEPLGWGLGLLRGGERIVKPVWDLGWYLRRGG